MDKICTTTYVITGEQSGIVKLHGRLLKLADSKKALIRNERYKTSLRCLAKLFFPDWVGFDIEGHFYDLQIISERKIVFTVETVNYPVNEVWLKICGQYTGCECLYFVRIPESGRYETNDEQGKYFPQRYLVVDSEDESKAVIGQKDLYEIVSRYIRNPEPFTSLVSLRKTVAQKIKRIRVFDIRVVDNLGNCISAQDSLIRPLI